MLSYVSRGRWRDITGEILFSLFLAAPLLVSGAGMRSNSLGQMMELSDPGEGFETQESFPALTSGRVQIFPSRSYVTVPIVVNDPIAAEKAKLQIQKQAMVPSISTFLLLLNQISLSPLSWKKSSRFSRQDPHRSTSQAQCLPRKGKMWVLKNGSLEWGLGTWLFKRAPVTLGVWSRWRTTGSISCILQVRILTAVHVSLDKILFRLGLLNHKNILGCGGRSQ